MKNMIGYNFYLFYYGISTIGMYFKLIININTNVCEIKILYLFVALIIELIVIGKFNKEYMISTDRYNSDVWYLNI